MSKKFYDTADILLPAIMLVGVCLEVKFEAEIYLVLITACSFVGFLFEVIKNS